MRAPSLVMRSSYGTNLRPGSRRVEQVAGIVYELECSNDQPFTSKYYPSLCCKMDGMRFCRRYIDRTTSGDLLSMTDVAADQLRDRIVAQGVGAKR